MLPEEAAEIRPVTRRRYVVYALLFFITFLNYFDRAVLSVAMPVLRDLFALSPITAGYLLSSFIWTYGLCMLPAGLLLDRWGVRRMGAVSLAFWSLATALSGLATGYVTLFVTRLMLGLGEAPTFPVGSRAVREWVPVRERGFATAVFTSGISVGTAVGGMLIAWLIGLVGWRVAFVLSGGLGFVWVAVWLLFFRAPEDARWLPEAERRLILTERTPQVGPAGATLPLRQLLASRSMWGITLTQGCTNYTQYLFLTWLPSYLMQSRGTNLMASGFDMAIVYLAAAVLIMAIGRITDKWLSPAAVQAGRRRYAVIALLLIASAVIYAPYANSTVLLLGLIALAVACTNSVFAMQWSLTNDLLHAGGSIGTAIAIMQIGGQVFGLAAPILTGYMVAATGTFTSAFLLAGLLLLLGALVTLTMTRGPIDGDATPGLQVPIDVQAASS